MYSMEILPAEQTLLITVGGFIKEEEAASYIKDYHLNVGKVQPSDFKLIIDAREQSTVPPAVMTEMQEIFKFYMNSGFKKLAIVSPTKTTAKLQVKRAGNEVSFTGQIVDTLEEALNF